MANELSVDTILAEVARELAAEIGVSEAEVLADVPQWRRLLGRWALQSAAALNNLVSSPDYWNAVPLDPFVKIKLKARVSAISIGTPPAVAAAPVAAPAAPALAPAAPAPAPTAAPARRPIPRMNLDLAEAPAAAPVVPVSLPAPSASPKRPANEMPNGNAHKKAKADQNGSRGTEKESEDEIQEIPEKKEKKDKKGKKDKKKQQPGTGDKPAKVMNFWTRAQQEALLKAVGANGYYYFSWPEMIQASGLAERDSKALRHKLDRLVLDRRYTRSPGDPPELSLDIPDELIRAVTAHYPYVCARTKSGAEAKTPQKGVAEAPSAPHHAAAAPAPAQAPAAAPINSPLPAPRRENFYKMNEITMIYGGGKNHHFWWRDGKLVRVLAKPRDNQRAPKELWVHAMPQLVPGLVFPLFLWRRTNQWEYMGHFRIREVSPGAVPLSQLHEEHAKELKAKEEGIKALDVLHLDKVTFSPPGA